MVRSPRATLSSAIASPRSLDLAILIVVISAACSAGFLMTRVGRLAALDQQVRQLESFGAVVNDDTYEQLRRVVPFRPVLSAAVILLGWPLLWVAAAALLQTLGNRVAGRVPRPTDESNAPRRQARFAQVLTIVVHASAILAVRAVVSVPIDVGRESLGGATSLGMLMPGLGESTFPARLLGAVDIFALWWVTLVAMGLGILYQVRAMSVARWLFGAYAAGAAALALTQALRGGM